MKMQENAHVAPTLALTVGIFLALAWQIMIVGSPAVAQSAQQTIQLSNMERRIRKLQPLSVSGILSKSAKIKATDMCNKQYWGHTAPDGITPWTLMKRSGYVYKLAGENLARGFNSDAAVVEAWLNSPAHRKNLLNPKFSEVGIATKRCTFGGDAKTLVVAHYGAPVPKQAGQNDVKKQAAIEPNTRTVDAKTQSTGQSAPDSSLSRFTTVMFFATTIKPFASNLFKQFVTVSRARFNTSAKV